MKNPPASQLLGPLGDELERERGSELADERADERGGERGGEISHAARA